jgi:hypothetical protein
MALGQYEFYISFFFCFAYTNQSFDYSLLPLISHETLLRNLKYKYSLEVFSKLSFSVGRFWSGYNIMADEHVEMGEVKGGV